MIKGAIFDVDGTLLDSMPTWHDLGSHYLRRLGLDAEPGLNEKLFTLSFEEGAAYMRERYHLSQDPAMIIQEILHMIADFYAEEVDFKPGMQSLLDFLIQQQIPMVIASSGHHEHIEKALLRLGYREAFLRILTCSEVGAGKSQPRIYLEASQILQAVPSEILVFEDALYAVQTASQAGFPVVGIYDTDSSQDEQMVRSLSRFYLKDINQDRIILEKWIKGEWRA